ncbi:MAG: hypothetical protein ACRECV_11260 [Xanthobacteraceae bacterium]
MTAFAPITETQLAQARNDPAFRQKLLEQSLDALLAGVQKLRNASPASGTAGAKQMREAIELAIRLAEIIQGPNRQTNRRA